MFDTGADVSTLTERTGKKLGLELEKPDRHLSGADGSQLNVTGFSSEPICGIIYLLKY